MVEDAVVVSCEVCGVLYDHVHIIKLKVCHQLRGEKPLLPEG